MFSIRFESSGHFSKSLEFFPTRISFTSLRSTEIKRTKKIPQKKKIMGRQSFQFLSVTGILIFGDNKTMTHTGHNPKPAYLTASTPPTIFKQFIFNITLPSSYVTLHCRTELLLCILKDLASKICPGAKVLLPWPHIPPGKYWKNTLKQATTAPFVNSPSVTVI